MYQAIETRFIGATNTKPSRIKATTGGGISATFPKDELMNATGNIRDELAFLEAAKRLATKMEWSGKWYGGATKNGYAWVNAAPDGEFSVALDASVV